MESPYPFTLGQYSSIVTRVGIGLSGLLNMQRFLLITSAPAPISIMLLVIFGDTPLLCVKSTFILVVGTMCCFYYRTAYMRCCDALNFSDRLRKRDRINADVSDIVQEIRRDNLQFTPVMECVTQRLDAIQRANSVRKNNLRECAVALREILEDLKLLHLKTGGCADVLKEGIATIEVMTSRSIWWVSMMNAALVTVFLFL